MASRAPGDDFTQQVRDVARFVRAHLNDLRALPRYRLHAVIDFGVIDTRTRQRPLLSWRIPAALQALLSKARLDVEISIYDP
jgi:hypothetical protein